MHFSPERARPATTPTAKKHELYLDSLNSPMWTHQGQSPSGARTHLAMWYESRTEISHTPVWGPAEWVQYQKPHCFFCFFFLFYLFSCMHVTFGRMLLMLQINPEALGRGRNLDRTSSQDSTRCESCLATEHEISSAGRWFIILLLQLGEMGR